MGGARLWTELLFDRRRPRDRVFRGAFPAALAALAAAALAAAVATPAVAAIAATAALAATLAAVATIAATVSTASSALLHATRRAAPVPATRECHRPSNAGGPAT